MIQKLKKVPLKHVYYLAFLFLIVVPLLTVLIVALIVLNKRFKQQAVENIERAQETIVTELTSDIDVMSMRLSHLIHTNNNEIIGYAAGTDTNDVVKKYENEQLLTQAGELALEPVKDVISVGFYMKDGKETYIKNYIQRETKEIKAAKWYQTALAKPNSVCVGSYNLKASSDLFKGGKKNQLVLVFALSPDVTTDRSQKLEMVTFYQVTGAGDTIKEYNQNYLKGNNKLGISRIVDEKGEIIFSTTEDIYGSNEYTCVKTPIRFGNTEWYVENYIRTKELTEEFWTVAYLIIMIAVLIFVLAGYYSGYFLRSIVKPITEINSGLKQVEQGNLDVHILPQGQFEVRSMIHQFNAMVRQIRALIEGYEEREKRIGKRPEEYLQSLVRGEMSPREVNELCPELFADKYVLLGMTVENYPHGKNDMDSAQILVDSFERNHRFASRCTLMIENATFFIGLYRITEEDVYAGVAQMAKELGTAAKKDQGVFLSICAGREVFGWEQFIQSLEEIRRKSCLHFLYGDEMLIRLDEAPEREDKILALSQQYRNLAQSLYVADEKNMVLEREKLFGIIESCAREEVELHTFGAILAIGIRFDADNGNSFDIFGKQYNYVDKVERLSDSRSLKLWITNYFAWIMDYSATKLNVAETDIIIKAKRYMADHYEDSELSLAQVADYVGLNEKYFTNRFSKETGETFSTYLTELRIQKAKELLRTTSFKIYEISEMIGYHNVEHFTRMFKKVTQMSPAQYRKTI